MQASAQTGLAFALLLGGTLLAIAGIDLVLPAVPSLPGALGGSATSAQWVLAAFVAGSGIGLICFGELGARYDQRRLLAASLVAYGTISGLSALAPSIETLIVLRFVQGASSSAAAVFAPGFVKAMFDDARAVRALGLLGSLESLVPALAPVAGAWLLAQFGWQASFILTAALALPLGIVLGMFPKLLPQSTGVVRPGGYLALFRDPIFLRYALSQAFALGGLLVFVFGAPAVIIGPLRGTLQHFVILQIIGVACFIVGANLASRMAARFGTERMITLGTAISAMGMIALVTYALAGGDRPELLPVPWVAVNLGFGLRGPPGFYRAIQAAHGDDARGSAIVILAIVATAALGTALAAPFIGAGLLPLALVAATISCAAWACLLLPRLAET